METKIDELNRKILRHLQENSRISFSSIGRAIGLTPPAVAERVKKMEDLGILEGYKARVNHLKLGYQMRAIVTIKAFMGKLKPFLEMVKSMKEVVNCYRITGNENIIMEVVLQDQLHLEQFVDKLIQYGETRTHIILSDIISDAPINGDKTS
ncbi:MAG: Lrp/AsnC family transcriptional regulator [Eudoraea sp.]|nr:Lrp/AsnC family transcriptional regulator [Eudoraea sp.]MBT8211329.1 Lrp/AsnC family transcriptional regulator [Eudoraea sp.]MBT8322067.1 Lrp/AsnC family transcriptional regulator [Eudoraea sp.]NNJ39687.1 Lrp/AsnC family transcriptional regulator [Eudoraea sp.]